MIDTRRGRVEIKKLTIEIETEDEIDQRKFELLHIYIRKQINPQTIRSKRE